MEIIIRTFKNFSVFPELLQAFSTRRGGVSAPPYNDLNLGLRTSDEKASVLENRRRFFNLLHIKETQLVFPEQVHGDRVAIVRQPGTIPACDGLITDQKDLFLTIQTADCFPVFLFEPKRQVAAIVHSGWRGTAKNITGKTINLIKEKLDGRAQNLIASIGPGVQQSCYQVDRPVAAAFKAQFLRADGTEHFLLDVQGAILAQLKAAGVPERQIQCDRTCTHCAAPLYYSYRRDGLNSGRMMGVIGIAGGK